jgi:hypothetical protein
LTASLSGNASGLKIERLDYDDGHDTVMRGGGQLNAQGGRLGLRIEAKRLRLLSGLLSRLLPPDLAGAVVRRASDWAPLALDLVVERTSNTPDRQTLALTGQAAGTQVRVDGVMPVRDGLSGFAGRVQLSHAAFPVLLRQFGFAVTAAPQSGGSAASMPEGRLVASVDLPRGRSDVRFEAAGLTADLDLRHAAEGLSGVMGLKGDNGLPLAQSLGLAAAGLEGTWPLSVKGPLRWQDKAFGFGPFDGTVAGRPVVGDLNVMPERNRIEGRLGLPALDVQDLVGLMTGPVPAASTGSFWPSARFADVNTQAVDLSVGLMVSTFTLGRDLALTGAKLQVQREGDALSLTMQEGAFGTGQLSGQMTVRRDGGRLGLTLRLAAKDMALADLLGVQGGWGGQVGFVLDGGSSGSSIAELVSRSSGAGVLNWRQGQISALDPSAIGRVVSGVKGMPDLARLRADMGRELQQAPFSFDKIEFPLSLSDGVLRMASVVMANDTAPVQMSGVFDLRTLTAEARLSMTAKPPQGWKGPSPDVQIGLSRSPDGSMLRDININSLFALLTTRAVEIETDRLIEEQKKQN